MIVVTTPTGNIGRQLVEDLIRGGAAVRVIARDISKLSPEVRDRVEVVEGSHGEASVVGRAFAGAESVFWLPPPNAKAPSLEEAYLDFTRPACDAIRANGVKRVVSVSALGRGTAHEKTAGLVSASLAMDDLIAGTGVSFRALAMPSFMDNMLRQVETIRTMSAFFSPIAGDHKSPTCATRDIAAAAAKLLLDPSWAGQGSVPVLGPEDLSPDDMARIMSEVLGKPIRHQRIPFEALEERLREGGMSEAFVRGYVEMMVAKNEGLDDAESRTREGTTPTTFHAWCEEVLKPAVQNQGE